MSDGSIAIIGASCRFPGAPDLEAFWELLTSGTDAISEIDDRRWSTRFYYHPTHGEPAKSYTWSAGLIGEVDLFEPAFFGISPREAAQMDPQQRILLELVWHAVEDAGIPAARLAGSATGVYIGGSSTDYRDLRLGDPASGDSYFMTGGTLSILANRVSYVFDLHGPSLVVDTACSSSLVALHEACEALRGGRIATAIVGGINLLLSPYPYLGFCRASMLSRRGRCFAFDGRADGYVRGEGGGVVILKPLAQALADGDRVRAVILGTGVNSDGRTIGLSLPSETAQSALIRTVYERAGVTPDDLAFFEMHGTGTPAGDPIEAAAVGHALGQGRRERLPIGSVKSNIGHLEPASGMAGLIKAALALDRGIVPRSLHCEVPNPNIPFDHLNLRLVQVNEPIAGGGCAGVNSFGFGGTNGHAVLRAPPSRRQSAAAEAGEPALPPLILSARTEASLRALAESWRDTLAAVPPGRAAAMLRGAARRRDQHPQRLVALGADRAETVAALADFAAGAETGAVVTGTAVREGRLAFVFSGNGAQWPGMGRDVYRASAGFRDAVALADGVLCPALGWSVGDLLERGADEEQLAHADIAQPLLFAIQVGIVTVLRNLGIDAAGHIGHSVGEIGAAWAAGALSLEDAARVVVARSRQQERTRGQGRMAALALGGEAARDLLAETGSALELGAINSTQSVTLSGPDEALERLAAEARRRGIAFRPLDLDFAFHSAAMDPIRGDLVAALAELNSAAPHSLLVSTVSGEEVGAGELHAEYWWRNIRHPVRFTEGMARLVGEGFRIFVEIGPNPVLQAYLHDALRAAEYQGRVLGTLSRKQGSEDPFPVIAARCHVAGHDITGTARFDGPAETDRLPLYPWERERFWFERTAEGDNPINPRFDHPLLGFRQGGAVPYWLNHLDPQVLPWIADHTVEGVPVLPAAAVVEMALAAARLRWPDAAALDVADVELRRPLPFDTGHAREIRSAEVGEDGDWELTSRARLADDPPTLHAVARLATAGGYQPTPLFGAAAPSRGELDAAALYRQAARLGLGYGPQFRTVRRIALIGRDEAVAYLDPTVIAEPRDRYIIHPALLDGALQGLLALIAGDGSFAHPSSRRGGDETLQAALAGATYLPWRFGRVRATAPFGREPQSARLRVTRLGTRSIAADIALLDRSGDIVAELSDCWFRRVELTRRSAPEDAALRVELIPAPLDEADPPPVLGAISDIVAPFVSLPEKVAASQDEQKMLLDALVAAVALQSVLDIVDPDVPFTIEEVAENGVVASGSLPLFEYLLGLLNRFGGATQAGPVWTVLGENDLPSVPEVWRLLLAESPDLVSELALIAAVGSDLPRILGAGRLPEEPPPVPVLEHLLHGSPAGSAGIELLCGVFGDIAARWPEGRPLRVLEIGADGGATRRLLDRLMQAGVAFVYTASTADPEQAARLGLAVSGAPGAGVACWSPGEPSEAIGQSRFDVIVTAHASARTRIDTAALAQLRDLLAAGGLLIGVEPDPNPFWDILLNRYAGWWNGSQSAGGGPCLRLGEDWRFELGAGGFDGAGSAVVTLGPWPSSVFWGLAPAEAPTAREPAAPAAVSLIALDGLCPAALRQQLERAGHRVSAIDAAAFLAAEPDGAEDAMPGRAEVAVAIVAGSEDPVEQGAQAISMLPRLAEAAARRNLALWLVTSGAQYGGERDCAGLVGAAAWGFARVLINETPRLTLRLLDLAPGMDWTQRGLALARELGADTPETEIVWTEAGRHVMRLRHGLPPRWAGPAESVALETSQQGGLDGLGWRPMAPRPPGPGEVAIEVHAAGLNFRDIMWAMGLLPEEALIDGFAGPTFGLEFAGIVRELGAGVAGVAVGDRVAGLAPASLSTRVTTAAHAVTPLPADTSFAAAATMPVAFVTAIYALGTLANVAPGEFVLVHAAAGGVGLAAIQYAKHRGANVIATAGSEVKRVFLRLAGADHVLDSRDLGFADAVRTITGGAGVDVVLNSLSGEAMEQSLGVLKPFGRFLELGKRDFYLNRRMHLRPLRQNISYFAIDVDQLPAQRPDLARSLLAEVAAALREGAIRPLAHRCLPFAAAGDAFRLMQASGHIGKLVLLPAENRGVRLRRTPDVALRRDGTYLVTGGITGFGFEAARWLAAQGAAAIALVGRRGCETPGSAERLAELAQLGADARIYAADVSDPASLSAALDAIRRVQPPLRGVIHAASTIADGLAAELGPEELSRMLRPKLGGAVLLDRLTRTDPIDLFVLFSSATTLLGAPGQGAYVAANLALEALARQRRAVGLPGLAVAWGPIEDAGYLAERPETREALARRLGAKPMPAAQALAALPALLGSGLPALAVAETSWNEARRFLPILAAPLFAEMRADAIGSSADDSLLERLAGLGREEAVALLKTAVAEEAANILRLPAGAVDPLRPLSEMGMDSLMAVELRLALESRLRVDLPLMSLAEGTSVASIATRLANAVLARPRASELLSLAERYEVADGDRLADVADAAEPLDPIDIKSAAAE